MTTAIACPTGLKAELLAIAEKEGYPSALVTLQRDARTDVLVIENQREAQEIVNIARIQVLDALLRYPYWDDSERDHLEEHGEKFQEVQMGVYEKAVRYVSTHFDVEPRA